jgi:hypothetical protein
MNLKQNKRLITKHLKLKKQKLTNKRLLSGLNLINSSLNKKKKLNIGKINKRKIKILKNFYNKYILKYMFIGTTSNVLEYNSL